MTKAIVMDEPGGSDVLRWRDIQVGSPGLDELRIRQTAVGVNYHDTYVRSGQYRTLPLPGIPGIEAAGVIEEVGPGVTAYAVGDRVAYVTAGYGAYAEVRILPALLAIKLPDMIDETAAAAILLKGLTACMLLRRVRPVQSGETILVHAAAGGVGQLLCAWARHLGVRVIGTAGSSEKADLARRSGAEHVIFYRTEDVASRVREITEGQGVAVAYDAVGRDTFMGSLAALDYFGTLVNYGQASGPVDPVLPSALGAKSNALVRPVVFHYLRQRWNYEEMAKELFSLLEIGVMQPNIGLRLPLSAAADAHRALEARATSGSILLLP